MYSLTSQIVIKTYTFNARFPIKFANQLSSVSADQSTSPLLRSMAVEH